MTAMTEPTAGATPAPDTPPPDPEREDDDLDELPDDLGDAGKAALRRERKARREAERKLTSLQARLAALEKAEAERQAAERGRQEAEAKQRGEWERIATEREAQIATLSAKLQAAEERLAAAIDLLRPWVERGWADLPRELRDLYTGPEDDILAMQAHLHRTAKLAERLKQARIPGNPPDGEGAGTAATRRKTIDLGINPRMILG